jgi:hypothetical protein
MLSVMKWIDLKENKKKNVYLYIQRESLIYFRFQSDITRPQGAALIHLMFINWYYNVYIYYA